MSHSFFASRFALLAGLLFLISGCKDQIVTPLPDSSALFHGKIVFTNFDMANPSAATSVMLMDSNGGNLQTISAGALLGVGGGRVAFGTPDGVFKIANLDGSDMESIPLNLSNGERFAGAALSPDGNHLAYVVSTQSSDSLTLFVTNIDGSQRVAISALLARETNVFFSNDSRSIAYYTSIDNGVTTNYFLEIASIDGKTRTPLTAVVAPGPDFSATVTWSPDDSRLVYTDRDSLFAITKSGQSKINVGEGATPAWSPDGSSLAYIVAPGELAVSSNLGVNYRQLTNTPDIGEIHPVWSQDGRFIVVMSWSGDYDHSTTSIKRVEVATGAMKTLYTPGYLPVFVE